jgi:beta-galactosidase
MNKKPSRQVIPFNDGWLFARFGPMPDGSHREDPGGIEAVAFDDAPWHRLDLPHDWGIEGPFREELPNNTGKLPWAGIGWYRKHFHVPKEDAGRRVYIDFDGAMSGTILWLNGNRVGEWPYGYSSFRFDLTDHLAFGEDNVLAVRLDNKPGSSRWYPGGGIYRNVHLVKMGPAHVAHWGTFVTTPEVTAQRATVSIKTQLEGPAEGVTVHHEVLDKETNRQVAKSYGADCALQVESPKLWDLEERNLYRLITTLLRDGEPCDTYETMFGIRTIAFTPDQGFLLNGRRVPLNGVCLHHDLGPLGTAVNVRAIERQIEILREMGCNAIRTSHNPPAPELLDLCDRMGMLVQVEAFDCWEMGKTGNDYALYFPDWHEADLRAMVRRDRNHPCVIMWSTGNELREQGDIEKHGLSRRLTDIVHAEDPTRPVTIGANNPASITNGIFETVDVVGLNYRPHSYGEVKEHYPDKAVHASETASTVSSRGEYFFPVSDDQVTGGGGWFQISSYDLRATKWAWLAEVEFEGLDRHPWVCGEFVWTGFDYLGEPSPYYENDRSVLLNFHDPEERKRMEAEFDKLDCKLPPRSSYFGIVDLCGFPKDRFYLYQSRWRPELPMAHILPHWNWPERRGEVTPVHVYTSGDEAELFLNGDSLGRRKKGEFQYRLRWDDVLYEPGELKVVAYKAGKAWAEDTVKTTGEAVTIRLSADRSTVKADGQDLCFVTVQISDSEGLLVPRSNHLVEFEVGGPGELIAVGNGNPTSHDPFNAQQRKAFNGLCLAVIRTVKGRTGTIRLHATSQDLLGASIDISSE